MGHGPLCNLTDIGPDVPLPPSSPGISCFPSGISFIYCSFFLLHSHGNFKLFEKSLVIRTYSYNQSFKSLKFLFQDPRFDHTTKAKLPSNSHQLKK